MGQMNEIAENLRIEARRDAGLVRDVHLARLACLAADEIDRLEADLAAARAEVERLEANRGKWATATDRNGQPVIVWTNGLRIKAVGGHMFVEAAPACQLQGVGEAARPRPQPDRDQLGHIARNAWHRANGWKHGEPRTPWEELDERNREMNRQIADAVAAAIDAAPLPTGTGRPAVIDDTKRLDWVERYEIDLTHCDMGWLGVGPESMTWASDFLPTIREVIDQGIDDHPGTLSAPSEATS